MLILKLALRGTIEERMLKHRAMRGRSTLVDDDNDVDNDDEEEQLAVPSIGEAQAGPVRGVDDLRQLLGLA